jgi:hypothetical protein
VLLVQYPACLAALLDARPAEITGRKDAVKKGEALQLHACEDVVDDLTVDQGDDQTFERELAMNGD